MGVETVVEVSPTDSKSLLVRMGGWMVDKTKIMQCHLPTEVVVEPKKLSPLCIMKYFQLMGVKTATNKSC